MEDPKPMTGALFKRGKLETDTQGEYHLKMKAETEVIHLQAKECQRLPTTTRSPERPGTDANLVPSEGA